MGTRKRKPLSEVTAERIIEYIHENHLTAGDQLPNESEFADKLDVGRSTVREAIKSLITRNIVMIKRGCGTFVASNPGVAKDPLGFEFVEDKKQLVIELLQVRAIIEPALAEMAAEHALPEEIDRLQEIETELEAAHNAGDSHIPFDIAFHKQIATCTHNHVTELLMPVLSQAIPAAIQWTHGNLTEESILQHQKIIQAIRNRDGEDARRIITDHLNMNISYILGE